MNREQAETLLAALVADELEEPIRGEVLAYLKTDAALGERLGDMRLAAGLLREGLEEASCDVPTALEASKRTELLALIEREPIMAAVPDESDSAVTNGALRSLFSIRVAGAVAACVALGVGLLGIMLPEFGDARRTARRMQNAEQYPEYGFGYAGDVPSEYDEVPRAALPDLILTPYESGGFGVGPSNGVDLAAGTRLRYDKIAIVDGRADDLLSASTGTLALGTELGVESDRRWSRTDVRPGKPQAPVTSSPEDVTTRSPVPATVVAAEEDSMHWMRPSDAGLAGMINGQLPQGSLELNLQAGDSIASLSEGAERFSHAAGVNPGIVTVNPKFGSPVDPLLAPIVESTPRPTEPGDTGGGRRSGVLGLEGVLGDLPQIGAQAETINDKSGLLPTEQWAGSQVWNDNHTDFDRGESFESRYADGRVEFDGEQGQQNASRDGLLAGEKNGRGHTARGKHDLDDFAKEAGLSLGTREVGKLSPPDETVTQNKKEPSKPSDPSLSFSIDLPFDTDFLQALDDSKRAALERRAEMSQALIDERRRNRRLSDNYLRIQEESKDLVPQFDRAPSFDLNEALSNSGSGGGGSGGSGKDALLGDLMSEARANTSADKAEQADVSLRKGQLNRAVQLYEDATLLDPDNKAYQQKLAEARQELDAQLRPLGLVDRTATDRSVDRKAAIAGYEKAMSKAAESLEKQDFMAASNAVIEARTLLSRERQMFDTEDFKYRVNRANQLQGLTQTTQARLEAKELSSIEVQRNEIESNIASETERRKVEEVQSYLRKARALQLEKKYVEALVELDSALFLEPDNAVIKGLRGMVEDTAVAAESFQLKRNRDLELGNRSLLNLEATTPFGDTLLYPGEWPGLSAARQQDLERGKDAEEAIPDSPSFDPEPEPTPDDADAEEERVAPPVNPWTLTAQDAQSTFALDTDTASYELARRTIRDQAQLPPVTSVRMEEFVNQFDYQYPAGRDAHDTFTVHAEAGSSPFVGASGGEVVLLKVGVRGRVVARDQMKPAHYVFVIDASGSMAREDRLPLVQQSLAMLLGQLGEQDTVSLVSYETRPYLLLEHASAKNPQAIIHAASTIQTGGSTNLTDGLKLGYQVASKHFKAGAVNRVILCSDGVANVGDDDAKEMLDAVNTYRRHGVTLMTVGVGVDGQTPGRSAVGAEQFNDGLMEQLANRGDGQYVYLGTVEDAQRQFVEDLAATRPTIAFDAKIQLAFDSSRVRRYRLIGYENRDIADRDFRNDVVDAGEVGSGQSATALYEIELWPIHRRRPTAAAKEANGQIGTVYVRYRDAQSDKIEETSTAIPLTSVREQAIAENPRFYLAACAAEFAELLRESEHAAGGSFQRLHQIAKEVAEALPLDKDAAELAELIGRAQGLPRAGQ